MATYNFNTSTVESRASSRSLLSKAFGYMAIFLGITSAIAIGLSFLLDHFITAEAGKVPPFYMGLIIGSSIMQIILTIWILFGSIKMSRTQVIPMVLYSICMGVLLSSFTFVLTPGTLGFTFLIAALAFGGMALVGLFSKKASALGMVGFGILFSVMLTVLFGFVFWILVPHAAFMMNIVVSILVIIAVMLITAYDVHNIKRISMAGENSSNLALYLAFNLYTDFVLILIRLLQIVAIFAGDRR